MIQSKKGWERDAEEKERRNFRVFVVFIDCPGFQMQMLDFFGAHMGPFRRRGSSPRVPSPVGRRWRLNRWGVFSRTKNSERPACRNKNSGALFCRKITLTFLACQRERPPFRPSAPGGCPGGCRRGLLLQEVQVYRRFSRTLQRLARRALREAVGRSASASRKKTWIGWRWGSRWSLWCLLVSGCRAP